MQNEIVYNKVFRETVRLLRDGCKFIVHKGGTGSGKTYDLMILLLLHIAPNSKNKVITVISESYPHLKRGVMRYAKKILSDTGMDSVVRFNQTEKTYTYPNGAIVEFVSTDRVGGSLGHRRHILYANELPFINRETYDEMARRSEINIVDFNPVMQFWLEDLLRFYDNHVVVKSNYLDNKMLPKSEKEKIRKRASLDENFRRIHIDCEYGNADDLVFLPERIRIIKEMPKDLKHTYGIDFGFSAPSAMVKTSHAGDDIYIDQIFYKSGMNEYDFRTELSGINRTDKIFADSEDQRMINFIYHTLKMNVHAAKKPAGSVAAGISFMQSKNINITETSIDVIREFRNLTKAKDRMGFFIKGKYNGDDHAIDATRYSLEDEMTGRNNTGVPVMNF